MTAIQHIPERAPFNYADLIEYREGQITSLALVRSKGVNIMFRTVFLKETVLYVLSVTES